VAPARFILLYTCAPCDKRKIPGWDESHHSHDSMKEPIVKAFEESIRVKQAFLRDNIETLIQVIELIVAAFNRGNKLLLFGNGGSAADAQHIAAEFTNRYLIERPPLPAIALTTDTSALTAIANDYAYDQIFVKQIQALGKAGDVAIAISTSGNSANVLKAVDACKAIGITTIGLTGGNGGKMTETVDYMLSVAEGKNSPRIQETHILVGHVICEIVDQRLFLGL
jgi:D-sedoheptulose 7-phosphate isomerase